MPQRTAAMGRLRVLRGMVRQGCALAVPGGHAGHDSTQRGRPRASPGRARRRIAHQLAPFSTPDAPATTHPYGVPQSHYGFEGGPSRPGPPSAPPRARCARTPAATPARGVVTSCCVQAGAVPEPGPGRGVARSRQQMECLESPLAAVSYHVGSREKVGRRGPGWQRRHAWQPGAATAITQSPIEKILFRITERGLSRYARTGKNQEKGGKNKLAQTLTVFLGADRDCRWHMEENRRKSGGLVEAE